jgi:hypothetical protein
MQICGHDALLTKFPSSPCHDTVSYYDTTLLSLLINYNATSNFCLGGMHDITYDTPIVASLINVGMHRSCAAHSRRSRQLKLDRGSI